MKSITCGTRGDGQETRKQPHFILAKSLKYAYLLAVGRTQ